MRRALHNLMVATLLGLIILLTAWMTWLAPPPGSLVAPLLLLLAGPLLVPLRGLLHGRRYTAAWTSLLALFYFAHGVAAMGTPGAARTLGAIEVGLSLTLFVSCLLYIRVSRQSVQDTSST